MRPPLLLVDFASGAGSAGLGRIAPTFALVSGSDFALATVWVAFGAAFFLGAAGGAGAGSGSAPFSPTIRDMRSKTPGSLLSDENSPLNRPPPEDDEPPDDDEPAEATCVRDTC